MTSFGYRLNPRYAIKECSLCGSLYTRDCSCSKGSVDDKILVPKPPENCASTNVVNAPREPFVVKQDHGVNPPRIDECCCECGEALDGIICQRCASDEVIKSSVENLVPILSEFKGIPDTMCDVHLVNNPTPLEAKDQF
nr:hypothetical protein [Tanacetum cinerariifolium]